MNHLFPHPRDDIIIVMLTQMFLLPQGAYLSMRRQKSGFVDD